MKWTYTYKNHSEVVTDEEKAQILAVTKNGSFTPISVIPTPPEAIDSSEKKTKQPKQID